MKSFLVVQDKIKKLKRALDTWSKETNGDIFPMISTLEDITRMKEIQVEVHPTEAGKEELSKIEDDLRTFHQIKKEY